MPDDKDISRCMQVAEGELFRGVDRLNGQLLNPAVQGTPAPSSLRSETLITMHVGESRIVKSSELSGGFGISVAGLFGVDASASTSQNSNISTYGLSVVAEVVRPLLRLEARTFTLKGDIKPPSSPESTADFVRVYGDSFISAVTVGGRCWMNYHFNATSKSQQKNIKAKVEASGILKVVGIEADLSAKMNKISSETQSDLRVEFGQSGVSNIGPKDFSNADKMVEYLSIYQTATLDAPEILGRGYTIYNRVPGFGTFQPVANNMDLFLDPGGLQDRLIRLWMLKRQIELIAKLYSHYGWQGDPKLEERASQVQEEWDRSAVFFKAHAKNPAQPIHMPELTTPALAYPEPNYGFKCAEACGNLGGGLPFDDAATLSFPKVKAVKMWSQSAFVDRIDVTYTCLRPDGTIEERTLSHGKSPDAATSVGPTHYAGANYVEKVDIKSGSRVDHVQLTAHDNNTTGIGGGGGGLHSWNATSDQKMVGFQGRSGAWIDMLQVKFIEFSPATWEPKSDTR